MNSWMIRNPGKLNTIYDLAPLIYSFWDKAVTQINIKSAFMCTEIHHIYNSIFDELDLVNAFVIDRPLSHIDELSSTFSTQLIQLPRKFKTVSTILVMSPEQVRLFPKARKNLTR